ncbi:hypothetical protein QCM80_25195, partial [Bradyrhizobium sp. SSUT112]|uniref:hypothetical protein n=1 Tax=Bradyrhizobium sp. SSUT112 TaxID=3040604 RepID=UPI0024474A01
ALTTAPRIKPTSIFLRSARRPNTGRVSTYRRGIFVQTIGTGSSRVIHNLERVWVRLLPTARACYDRSLKACVLDERYILPETTTLERIACTIIHEATHARLERWGINYGEKKRSRIEAVCLRRELHFIAKLPRGEQLWDERALTLEWCISDHDHFSDGSFQQRNLQGAVETLRYLDVPDWLIRFLVKVRAVVSGVHQLVHRVAGRPRRKA